MERRQFLSLAAASMASAAFVGCTRRPLEKIIPYLATPEDLIAGNPQYFSSAWTVAGQTQGLLIESHLGRPTRVDGHPEHPASLGKATSLHQALLLSLYDENRQAEIRNRGVKSSWDHFTGEMQDLRKRIDKTGGKGVVFLTEISTSPTLKAQFKELQRKNPHLQWIQYEPISSDRVQRTAKEVFGQTCVPVYHLDQAEMIVSLDADFFGSAIYPTSYTTDFFQRRSQAKAGSPLPQLMVVEPTPSLTGAWTPDRLILKSSQFPSFCQTLWQQLHGQKSENENHFIQQIKTAVSSFPGRCVFMAGIHQPDIVHEICHRLNFEFGKKAVAYRLVSPSSFGQKDLKNLSTQLEKSEIEALFVIGGNPAYQSPVDLNFGQKLGQAKSSYRFSLTEDETSLACAWQLPLAHDFEAWSDGQAFDGTLSVHQPLIAPLFQGKNIHEILSLFSGEQKSSYTLVTDFWKKKLGTQYSHQWEDIVQNGIFKKNKKTNLSIKPKKSNLVFSKNPPLADDFEILFRADPHVWDGRFAGNSWLQELPKPLTLLTWGNAALISPALASELKISPGQVIEITTGDGKLRAPAWILPGQEAHTVTLHFGYGRTRAGKTANHLGFNAYQIWNSDHPDFRTGQIAVTSEKQDLACTQSHFSMEGTDLIPKVEAPPPSLYEKDPLAPVASAEAWAMVIDLDHCIGCNACSIACQSENNIPIVGKEGVLRGREMHWIRVDRYFTGDENSPGFLFQPVPCMHCEKAPCEEVCPVAATVHSTDGLNQMVYNRCVGTRYCANNCPYKVRRFNFFSLTSNKSELHKLLQNPEVSVRPRGVMEKCTYCVQRINAARIDAQKDLRPIKDGEIKPACQVTCPTEAITFGNQNDPLAKVSQLKKKSRNYALLEELGTRPRTTYLKKIEAGVKDD